MTYTATAKKDDLKGMFNIDNLPESNFKITINPITEDEADEIEFKSLKESDFYGSRCFD